VRSNGWRLFQASDTQRHDRCEGWQAVTDLRAQNRNKVRPFGLDPRCICTSRAHRGSSPKLTARSPPSGIAALSRGQRLKLVAAHHSMV
jgi:hypothetical protein